MKLFSYKHRPFHLGPYPLERLRRQREMPDLDLVPAMQPVSYDDADNPESLVHAMGRYIGMLDVVRDGAVTTLKAEIPDDPTERANHLKAAGYYFDARMVGVCRLSDDVFLEHPFRNPALDGLAEELSKNQPKTFAAGIDLIADMDAEDARRLARDEP